MENKDFKKLFGSIANEFGFESAFDGWFKESEECIMALGLQKSGYGNYYYLNIKIYIQGVFGKNYIKSKDLVKKNVGNIFRRQPKEYQAALNLEDSIGDDKRKQELQKLFSNFLVPFSEKALTKSGIRTLFESGEISLLPAVKEELVRLGTAFVKKSNELS